MNKEQIVLSEYNLCVCGCKTKIPKLNSRNKPSKYVKGHNLTPKHGDNHPSWKGGIARHGSGYVWIWTPKGYILKHRLVYEEYYNCCLLPHIIIHHKNHNRLDNRIENLEPMTREEHNRLHNTKKNKY